MIWCAYAHQIIVLGYALLDNDLKLVEIDAIVGDERTILLAFSRRVEKLCKGDRGMTIVSFNGRTFDLPVIVLRSLHHAVPLPWYYRVRGMRYRFDETGHLDIADALTDYGAGRMVSLDNAAKLVGLPGKVGVDGSQVSTLYAAGRLDEIAAYCVADVAQTALVMLRFKHIQFELTSLDHEHDLRAAFALDPRLAEIFPVRALAEAG